MRRSQIPPTPFELTSDTTTAGGADPVLTELDVDVVSRGEAFGSPMSVQDEYMYALSLTAEEVKAKLDYQTSSN